MSNHYVLFKGRLTAGIPYYAEYGGNPHYVLLVDAGDGQEFKIVTNVKSDSSLAGPDGYQLLYVWSQYFTHPMRADLQSLAIGLHDSGFPLLDYVHDPVLVDLTRMRPVPVDVPGDSNDCNDILNQMLALDMNAEPRAYEYQGTGHSEVRKAYPSTQDVMVYGFGFGFPDQSGLHETHMNQGNPKIDQGGAHGHGHGAGGQVKDHSKENGVNQDGAVIIEIGGKFQAFFAAFQTQRVPTDSNGYPTSNSRPILA